MQIHFEANRIELEDISYQHGLDSPDFLGKGGFGEVYRAKCWGSYVAFKVPNNKREEEDQLDTFAREIEMISRINHPYVVLFLGYTLSDNRLGIVMEYLECFGDALLDTDKYNFTLYERMGYAKQVAEGMAWLHGCKIVHCDLKPSNLLWDKNKKSIKITDFGLAVPVSDVNHTGGSKNYIPPEVFRLRKRYYDEKNEQYLFARDVYAYGVTILQFVSREKPFFEESFEDSKQLKEAVKSGDRPYFPKNEKYCPSSIYELVQECWKDDVMERPTFVHILASFDDDFLIDAAIFENVIDDGPGRTFWKTHFSDPLIEEIPFETFLPKFQELISCPDKELPLLKSITNFLFSKGGMVTLEQFGRILGYFVPLDKKWLKRVVKILKSPWYFGDINKEEAFKYLRGRREKEFLLRFSSDDFCWILSYIQPGKKILHLKLEHDYCSKGFYLERESQENIHFRSIFTLVEYFKKHKFISKPISVNYPSSNLFTEDEYIDQGYGFFN